MKIAKLSAKSVRGIPRNWPDLEFGESGLLIHGDNGVGKSSIIDALEYVLTNRSTVYPDARQGVTWQSGGPHVINGTPDLHVSLVLPGTSADIQSGVALEEIDEPFSSWLRGARDANFVLRRHMLLKFISEEPRNRYGLLQPFMNFTDFECLEARISEMANDLDTTISGLLTTINELSEMLRRTFELSPEESVSSSNMTDKVNVIINQIGLDECKESSDFSLRKKDVSDLIGDEERGRRIIVLGNLKIQVEKLSTPSEIIPLVQTLRDAIVSLENEIRNKSEQLLTDWLVEGRDLIENGDLTACPLCDQPIDRDTVLMRLSSRIEADQRVTAARKLATARQKSLTDRVASLSNSFETFNRDWNDAGIDALPSAYAVAGALLDELNTALNSGIPSSVHATAWIARLKESIESHSPIMSRLDDLIKAEGGDRRQHLLRVKSMLSSLIDEFPRLEINSKQLSVVQFRRNMIGRILDSCIDSRKSAAQSTLDIVSGLANSFYGDVHPNEGFAGSQLSVRHVGTGSVNLTTLFQGSQEHPMLHYSESHLDTLGLCYFLAMRRREADIRSDFKILVLDDVMHSVDAAHRTRVVKLLKDNFADHQIILTTHDMLFFEALRRSFGTAGYRYIRITGWDLIRGPALGDSRMDYDRIMVPEIRESESHENLAAASGRFFEWFLKEIAEAIEVAVPARFNRRHDIGSLWPGVARKMRRHRGFSTAHGEAVSGIDENSWVRNECGGHHNVSAAPVTHSEVRAFAGHLACLVQATQCGQCRRFISRQPNDDWTCHCGAIRYPSSPAQS